MKERKKERKGEKDLFKLYSIPSANFVYISFETEKKIDMKTFFGLFSCYTFLMGKGSKRASLQSKMPKKYLVLFSERIFSVSIISIHC